jgi:hypothetical protein
LFSIKLGDRETGSINYPSFQDNARFGDAGPGCFSFASGKGWIAVTAQYAPQVAGLLYRDAAFRGKSMKGQMKAANSCKRISV